jgi:phosphatidylserine/phosphatidylglycerophosphate/cardiolipin synthase-like enzyme
MDVGLGRWDTQKHDDSKARRMNGYYLGNSAIHDSGMRMTGPIVIDYERQFHESYNCPYPAFFPFHILPKYDWVEPPYERHENSGFQIQLLRNLGCKGAQKGFY